MRLLVIVLLFTLTTLAWARPVTDKYMRYSVPAPDDWGSCADPLGLNVPGSAWFSSQDGKNVIGVSTLPANTPEEQKMPLEVVAEALSGQLKAKGFRCTLTPGLVAGQPGCLAQGVNKLKQRIAIIVTRKGNALAITYYLTAGSTEAYSAMLKSLVDGLTWAKAPQQK